MKTKDFLIVALAPIIVLMIPLVAMRFTREVNWTLSDFIVMWVLLAGTTFFFRLLVTRKSAGLTYRLGALAAVGTGFLMTWVNLAVQIIGDDNPANDLYFGVVILGLAGTAVARLQPAGLAWTAFACAIATFLVPVVAFIAWPDDFSPGTGKVFVLNGIFILGFVVAGSFFRHAAGKQRPAGDAVAA